MALPKYLKWFLQKNNYTSAIHVKVALCIPPYPKTQYMRQIEVKYCKSYIHYIRLPAMFLNIEVKVIERICVCSTSIKRKHTYCLNISRKFNTDLDFIISFDIVA